MTRAGISAMRPPGKILLAGVLLAGFMLPGLAGCGRKPLDVERPANAPAGYPRTYPMLDGQ